MFGALHVVFFVLLMNLDRLCKGQGNIVKGTSVISAHLRSCRFKTFALPSCNFKVKDAKHNWNTWTNWIDGSIDRQIGSMDGLNRWMHGCMDACMYVRTHVGTYVHRYVRTYIRMPVLCPTNAWNCHAPMHWRKQNHVLSHICFI